MSESTLSPVRGPSTSLGDMPDDILIKLFNITSPRDVTRVKRISKRFNKVVETYNLGKPIVKELSIESRLAASPPKIGRIRFGPPPKLSQKRRLIVTMKRDKGVKRVEKLDDPSCSEDGYSFVKDSMRKVVVNDRLSFEGVTIDQEFYKMLTAKWNDLSNVTTVSLSFCHITLCWSDFAHLLSKMTLKSLCLDFCTFDASLISDKVLLSLAHLETLKIQPRTHCYFNELTDRTLNFWARNETPPKQLQMYNCATSISIDGIRTLMQSVAPTSTIDWDFGLLLIDPNDSVLLSLIFSPGLQFAIADDFRSRRVKLRNDRLQLSFNIHNFAIQQQPQPQTA